MPTSLHPVPSDRGRELTAVSRVLPPLPPLPSMRTPFVGRSAELAALTELATRPETRLIVLTGPGGIGKTRLALAVASAVSPAFRHGVAFVPLAGVSDTALLPETIAAALGLPALPDATAIDSLIDGIGGRACLIVLDNFEQLIEAAPLLGTLLDSLPKLRLLVTSRVRLHIRGERLFPLLGLPLPLESDASNLVALCRNPAVELFRLGCEAVDPGFAVTATNAPDVISICRQLEGWPLALELAAARTQTLPAAAVRSRLHRRLELLTGGPADDPGRFRSMRAALDWSYQLLDETDRAVFRRLAVFRGGFDLEAAGAVALDSRATDAALPSVASLVAKSLVQRMDDDAERPRFSMLDTLREFGLERLTEAGELDQVAARHAGWFAGIAKGGAWHLKSAEAPHWIRVLNENRDNLRATLDWFDRANDDNQFMEVASNLATFWDYQGELNEGRFWLERAFAKQALDADGNTARGRAWLGWFQLRQGQLDEAERSIQAAIPIFREIRNDDGLAYAHGLLGTISQNRGDMAGARRQFETARDIFARIPDMPGYIESLLNLSDLDVAVGELESGLTNAARALELAERHDIQTYIAVAQVAAAQSHLAANHDEHALASARSALDLAEALGFSVCAADAWVSLASLAAATGQFTTAARLLAAAEARLRGTGSTRFFFHAQFTRTGDLVRASLGPARYERAWAEGVAMPLAGAAALARAVELTAQPEPGALSTLTAREREVLALLAQGKTDREIADAMFISYRTANSYVARVLAKLNVSTRTAAATMAIRDGLV